MREFDYDLDYKNLDLRAQPELYRVGRGEQGVLLVEPYKSKSCRTGALRRLISRLRVARLFIRCF